MALGEEQGSDFSSARKSPWFLVGAIPPVLMIVIGLFYGPALIDDAYITFRYAHNLATGQGLVFNSGEYVLGTTTPFWAALLACVKVFGGGAIPEAARWLGLFFAAALVLLTQLIASRSCHLLVCMAIGLCLALHPDMAFSANSGMETTLNMVVVYGVVHLLAGERYDWAAALGGLGFLVRPDCVLLVCLAIALSVLRRKVRAWRTVLVSALVLLPWLVYATSVYGSPIPHSVQAKQLIHPATPSMILYVLLRLMTLTPPMIVACILALLGAVHSLARRSSLRLVALWMVLYVAGMAASRVMPIFPWYTTPLLPALLLLGGYGAVETVGFLIRVIGSPGLVHPRWNVLAGALALLIVAGLLVGERDTWRQIRQEDFGRVPSYLIIGQWLRGKCGPADVVLVGEVGALGWALLDQRIIDSSGINSTEAYSARLADRTRLGLRASPEGSPAWVAELIRTTDPRYIVTYSRWLHLTELRSQPWFSSVYRRAELPFSNLGRYWVLERFETG